MAYRRVLLTGSCIASPPLWVCACGMECCSERQMGNLQEARREEIRDEIHEALGLEVAKDDEEEEEEEEEEGKGAFQILLSTIYVPYFLKGDT